MLFNRQFISRFYIIVACCLYLTGCTSAEVVLNLESDDNPSITNIVAAPTTFAESASSTITATIDLPSSKDVIVPIAFSGTASIDIDYTGTFPSLMQASQFVQVIEERQGLKVGCIEEVAFRMNFISADQLKKLATPLLKSGYGQYLMNLIKK